MRNTTTTILGASFATLLLLGGNTGCESTTASDVAYEDAYAGSYYYPADVAVAGAYGVGWGYGLYYDTAVADAMPSHFGNGGNGGTGIGGGGGIGGSGGSGGSGGAGGSLGSGTISVRSAVGEAIRLAASGADVCGGNATFTRTTSSTASVCGISAAGFNLVFSSCTLAGGGTVDGTVGAQVTFNASDTNCNSATMLNVSYTGTVTNLTYTGTGGGKIVIPSQTDMATIQTSLGAAPATIGMMSSGEIQRIDGSGTTTSDLTFTGNRTFSAISFPNQTYTVDGTVNFTDKSGGTGTVTASGLVHDNSCCKPTAGTLSINRMGGSHSGSHSWTFSSSCGTATLDGKTVTLPACL
ncbi:MAG TPA: hypothetical protein VMT03_22355 [Polyangia bacterium]|nr:hypothetical protein [Polyangia bacterium]